MRKLIPYFITIVLFVSFSLVIRYESAHNDKSKEYRSLASIQKKYGIDRNDFVARFNKNTAAPHEDPSLSEIVGSSRFVVGSSAPSLGQ